MNTDGLTSPAESAPAALPPTAPAFPPPSEVRRWPWIALAVGAFLLGAACGSGLTLLTVMHRVRQAVRQPEIRAERTAQYINRRLSLTPEQRRQVLTILREQNAEMGKLRRETLPRVAERFEMTRDAIARVLTPEQQKIWRVMAEEFRRKLQPALPGARAGEDGR